MNTLLITSMLVVFFGIMIGIGIYCRRHSTDVGGFVLGGRSIGPWLTAFAFGTSYFSAVIFVGYAGQFGWNFGIASTWIGLGNAFIGSLLAWVVLAVGNGCITHRHGELHVEPAAYGHGIAITKTHAPVFALVADAALPFEIPLSGLGINANKVPHQLVSLHTAPHLRTRHGLEPPTAFCPDAQETYAMLVVAFAPSPPWELVIPQQGKALGDGDFYGIVQQRGWGRWGVGNGE